MKFPKNKYRKGYIIYGWSELMYENLDKGKWVYLRNRVMHLGVILHMNLKTVNNFLEKRQLSEAIDQHKEYYAKTNEISNVK